MSALIDQMHSRNVRVILWVTTMINTDSSNFEYGKSKVRSSYIVLAASYFSVKRAIIYPDWMAILLNGGTVLDRSLVFTATILFFFRLIVPSFRLHQPGCVGMVAFTDGLCVGYRH